MNLKLVSDYSEKARTSLSAVIKIVLIISIAYTIYSHLWRILFINIFLLILVFIPSVTRKYDIQIPKEIEYLVFLFVIISFFLGDIRGTAIQIFFGITVGFVGFMIMLILFSKSRIKTNYFLIIIFSISFSVALGAGVEVLKYYTKVFLENQLSIGDYEYAIESLTYVAAGALLASLLGFVYMKGHRGGLMDRLVLKFKKQNPNLFIKKIESPHEVSELIKQGESQKLEFKETLRINIYTDKFDKNVELANLKSITALMNTEGGTLLIGVNDKQEIKGIENDGFSTSDKFCLHFSNLIKEHIGNQYLPYLSFDVIKIDDKYILKVDCIRAPKPVFLRIGKQEEFYIRIGPASVQLTGSKLIEYIRNNFR